VADHNQCLAGRNFARFRRGNLRLVGIIVRDKFERMTADTALSVNLVKVEVDRIKRFFTAAFQQTTQRYDDCNSNRVLRSRSAPNNVGQQTEKRVLLRLWRTELRDDTRAISPDFPFLAQSKKESSLS
jgi:hypothetical protein